MSGEHKVLGDEIQSYSHSDPNHIRLPMMHSLVSRIIWSPDGARLASLADASDQLVLWDALAKHIIETVDLGFPHTNWPRAMTFTNDGKAIVMFGIPDAPPHNLPDSFTLIDGISGKNVRHFTGPIIDGNPSRLSEIAVSPTGNWAAMLFNFRSGQTLALYDATSWQVAKTVFTITGLRAPEYQDVLAITPDGLSLALLKRIFSRAPVKDDPTHTRTYPITEYELVLLRLSEADGTVSTKINSEERSSSFPSILKFSPGGEQIAVGMANEDLAPIRILDGVTGTEIHRYRSPLGERGWPIWGTVHSLDWSPDRMLLAFCGDDRSVHILDAESGEVFDSVKTEDACRAISFSPDGTMLAYGSGNTVIIRKIKRSH